MTVISHYRRRTLALHALVDALNDLSADVHAELVAPWAYDFCDCDSDLLANIRVSWWSLARCYWRKRLLCPECACEHIAEWTLPDVGWRGGVEVEVGADRPVPKRAAA